jgi:hypothetical protein
MSSKKKLQGQRLEIDAARLTDLLLRAEYVDRKSFYLHGFLRGVIVGAGGVIGATVVIAFLAWILSLFDTVPLIGPLIENTQDTINQR